MRLVNNRSNNQHKKTAKHWNVFALNLNFDDFYLKIHIFLVNFMIKYALILNYF